MSKKVIEMGGNAVLGYHQSFDVEGDSGLVARSYGTCVLIARTVVSLKNAPSSIVGSKASGASAAYRDAGRQVTEMSPLSSRFSTRGVQLRHILLLLLLLVVIFTYYYYCVLLLWIYYYYC